MEIYIKIKRMVTNFEMTVLNFGNSFPFFCSKMKKSEKVTFFFAYRFWLEKNREIKIAVSKSKRIGACGRTL